MLNASTSMSSRRIRERLALRGGALRSVVLAGAALLALAAGCSSEPETASATNGQNLIEAHACSATEVSRCNCPNDMFCCAKDGSCFKDFDGIVYTQCKDDRATACGMSGVSLPGAGGGGGGGRAACSAPQREKCNCPGDFSCCPTDGSCFKNDGDIQFTQCKDKPSTTCAMSGDAAPPAPPPPAGPAPPGNTPPGGPIPTRLRITSRCAEPVWIAHSDNVGDPQNVKLARGQSYDYRIPDSGLSATRFWPKTGCDDSGHGCKVGDNGEGGGKPCPKTGCQPPVDSKFEATFARVGGVDQTWYNLSQVDGYTLPFKVLPTGAGAQSGSCVASDCSGLSLDRCPGDENLSGGGKYPGYGHEDLRVRDASGKVIACMAPCKKWNYPAPWGLGQSESNDPGLHMCCPTPIDPAKSPGQCTVANKCMTSESCSDTRDPLSVVHTDYVAAMRAMCPSAYSYAYDDAAGLHACPSTTGFEVIFCP